jgi:ABC-type transporter Mla subunit MlaD
MKHTHIIFPSSVAMMILVVAVVVVLVVLMVLVVRPEGGDMFMPDPVVHLFTRDLQKYP